MLAMILFASSLAITQPSATNSDKKECVLKVSRKTTTSMLVPFDAPTQFEESDRGDGIAIEFHVDVLNCENRYIESIEGFQYGALFTDQVTLSFRTDATTGSIVVSAHPTGAVQNNFKVSVDDRVPIPKSMDVKLILRMTVVNARVVFMPHITTRAPTAKPDRIEDGDDQATIAALTKRVEHLECGLKEANYEREGLEAVVILLRLKDPSLSKTDREWLQKGLDIFKKNRHLPNCQDGNTGDN